MPLTKQNIVLVAFLLLSGLVLTDMTAAQEASELLAQIEDTAEESASIERSLVYLLPLENRTGAAATEQERLFAARFGENVLEVLQNEFASTDFDIITLQPNSTPNEVPIARIGGYFYIQGNWFVLTIQTTAGNSGTVLETDVIEGQVGVVVYTRIVEAVRRIVPDISGAIATSIDNRSEIKGLITTNVRFVSSLEGSEIYYHADDSRLLGIIEDGGLNVPWFPFPAGERLTVEQRQEGYYVRPQSVLIENDATITLSPPPKEHTLGVSAWWTIGQAQGAGLGVRWYVIPDTLFVGLDNYFYVQSYQNERQAIYHNDLRAMVGLYVLLPPTSPFRLGLATGFGTIVTDVFEATAFDLYVSLVDVWAQIEILDWLVLFMRSEVKWALGNENNLLGAGRLNNGLGELLEVDFLSVAALSIGTELRF